MAKLIDMVTALTAPIAAENGCGIWDIEYVKEGGSWFLRVYLDRPEGISIEHCEAVSRSLSLLLDESDPIEGSYTLEVSSSGADRALRRPEHFTQCMGQEVEVRFYHPIDGRKSVTGTLTAQENGDVTIETPEGPITFVKKDIAQVKLYITF